MNMLTSQSTKNLASIMLGFGIGAVNTLVFYPYFFGAEKQGLVVFLLAVSNLLMPLIGFGVAQTIIKFHSSYAENERQGFLSYVVLLPLLIALPLGFVAIFFHDAVAGLLSVENPIIASYTWVIFSVAFATAYFEVFYSWARVHFKSVLGNTLKEIYPRLSIFILLLLYAAKVRHYTSSHNSCEYKYCRANEATNITIFLYLYLIRHHKNKTKEITFSTQVFVFKKEYALFELKLFIND